MKAYVWQCPRCSFSFTSFRVGTPRCRCAPYGPTAMTLMQIYQLDNTWDCGGYRLKVVKTL